MDKNTWVKIDYWAKKLKALEFLGKKCSDCGETNIFKLAFHHTNPMIKDAKINDLKYGRWSNIEREIMKCILLCNNCHNKFHANQETKCKDDIFKNNKKIYLEFKGIFECEECGYNENNSSLEFHHLSNDKDFILSEINVKYRNVNELTYEIKKELNKCIVLCRNCHIVKHTDTEFYKKYEKEILEKSNSLKEIQSKLDRDKVINLYNSGVTQIKIAEHFNAAKSTISNIIKKYENK